jgi:small subunit ribosomal protein S2
MRPFIFTERNGIHIIDLQQTVTKLNEAYNYVRDAVASGKTLLFVGTKKQAQEAVESEAKRADSYYVNQRWLGGMLTNFRTIQSRIRLLEEMEARRDSGDLARLTKKEAGKIEEEILRLNRLLGGIRKMRRLPDIIFIIDPHKEKIAIMEAKRLEIPVVAVVDTNCNPEEIDYPVPANDDAIRAVKLLSSKIADAAIEGLAIRESQMAESIEAGEEIAPEGVEADVTIAEFTGVAEAAPDEQPAV